MERRSTLCQCGELWDIRGREKCVGGCVCGCGGGLGCEMAQEGKGALGKQGYLQRQSRGHLKIAPQRLWNERAPCVSHSIQTEGPSPPTP